MALKNNLLVSQLLQKVKVKDPQLFDTLNALAENINDAGSQITRLGNTIAAASSTSGLLIEDDIYKVVSLRV